MSGTKNIDTHTKDMIIKDIAYKCHQDFGIVKSFYNALEEDIAEILSKADEDNDVMIRLFEGISICSEYIPEKIKMNNLTGNVINTSSKIKPKAKITRSYCNKITHLQD